MAPFKSVREIFDQCAQVYDQELPKLVPNFDLFYGTLLRQLPFPTDAPIRILDVGAGTGLVTSLLAQQFPRATFVLTDFAEKMLDVARQRFAGNDRVSFQTIDSRDLRFHEEFDAVVSALSIHHVDHEGKQDIYIRIFRALKPGGVFVHAEQVLGPTSELEVLYQKSWVDGIRSSGLPEDRVEAALERVRQDLNAPLADQLEWLRDMGFHNVDCWYKYYRFAVFGGAK
jgi:tRNA (cmo5U34)-methyltransferase